MESHGNVGFFPGRCRQRRRSSPPGYPLDDTPLCRREARAPPTAPTKADDDTYTYAFAGWDKEIVAVTADATYRATYRGHKKTIPPDLDSEHHIAYVKGYGDGTVAPEGKITRAETATMLYRLLKAERRDAIFCAENTFSDVKAKDWHNKAVSSMARGLYIKGYKDGTFLPGKNITRAEFVTMLVRFMEARGGTLKFSDVPATHWAATEIATATSLSWISGDPGGTFRPDVPITRAEAMSILNRVLDRGIDADSVLGAPQRFKDNAAAAKWYYYDVIEATNDHEYTGHRPNENWTKNEVTNYSYDAAKYERPDA